MSSLIALESRNKNYICTTHYRQNGELYVYCIVHAKALQSFSIPPFFSLRLPAFQDKGRPNYSNDDIGDTFPSVTVHILCFSLFSTLYTTSYSMKCVHYVKNNCLVWNSWFWGECCAQLQQRELYVFRIISRGYIFLITLLPENKPITPATHLLTQPPTHRLECNN